MRRAKTVKAAKSPKCREMTYFEDEIPATSELASVPPETNAFSRRVIGIAIAHRRMRPGLPEEAHERAMAIDFDECGIRYARQHRIPVAHKGTVVCSIKLDFLVEGRLVIEVKSLEVLSAIDTRQVVRYPGRAERCPIELFFVSL
jgi:GxxExxY protein